jgi:hypothetical protein
LIAPGCSVSSLPADGEEIRSPVRGFRNAERRLHPAKVLQTTPSRQTTRRGLLRTLPQGSYLTEVEHWRYLQSDNVEFTIKRLRKPIDADNHDLRNAKPRLSC